MLLVHHMVVSQSDRVVWLCEELGLPYDLRVYKRLESRGAPDEYAALHPYGTAPVITDGDLVLGESGAIVEYICVRHAGARLIVKPDHPEYANYLYWYHFANGSMLPAMTSDWVNAANGTTPQIAKGRGRTERGLAMANRRLGEVPYFAGEELTAADIMMCLPRFIFKNTSLSEWPSLSAYAKRIEARPAWQRMMATRELVPS